MLCCAQRCRFYNSLSGDESKIWFQYLKSKFDFKYIWIWFAQIWVFYKSLSGCNLIYRYYRYAIMYAILIQIEDCSMWCQKQNLRTVTFWPDQISSKCCAVDERKLFDWIMMILLLCVLRRIDEKSQTQYASCSVDDSKKSIRLLYKLRIWHFFHLPGLKVK